MEAGGTGNPAGLRPGCDEPCSSGTQLSTPAGCSRSGPAEPLWGWDVGMGCGDPGCFPTPGSSLAAGRSRNQELENQGGCRQHSGREAFGSTPHTQALVVSPL